MAKRRVSDDSDVEEVVGSSPASKRARVEDDQPEELQGGAPNITRAKRSNKGKGKHTQQDNEDEGMQDAAEEEKAFEESQTDRLRHIIENRSKIQGGIADHGIIESLEMHQFMCHKYLTFAFGPQINFIIGHNGSGKSAVLTALSIALGGKAGSTGRGTGLKSFIREGQSASEVSVCIKNRGEEAYRPDLYGKSIIVTRRFTKDGSSTWKIKNAEGKVVSTKREELSSICDHMNIQVDNPMNVLTQDAARQFLSASSASDKYKFFLRGTQLSQLSEEYETCMENVTQTQKVIEKKKEALPDLKAALKEATTRFEEASKAREQRHKVDELKKELAWAHVASKEKEMQENFEALARAERRLPKVQERVERAQKEEEAATADVRKYEQEHEDFGTPAELEQRKKDVNAEINSKKGRLKDIIRDITAMNAELKRHNESIAGFQKAIAEEEAKIAQHSDGRREEAQRKLKAAEEDLKRAESLSREIVERRDAKKEERRLLEAEGQAATATVAEKQQAARDNQMAMQRMLDAQNDQLAVYGSGMARSLEQIRAARWYGEAPLGPFGQYVKLRDEKWAPVMRLVLGHLMFGFRITDGRDRQQLKHILDANRCTRVNIVVSGSDLFDYSRGEPSPDKLTFLRALDISNEHVARVLINSARIEKRLLYDTRYQAQEELRNMGGGEAYTLDLFQVRNYGDGGEQSAPIPQKGGADFKSLFTNLDPAAEYQRLQQDQFQLDEDFKAAQRHERELRQRYQACQAEIQKLDREGRAAQTRQNDLRAKRNRCLDEANIEVPVGIAPIEAAKREVEEEKAELINQYEAAERQKKEIDEDMTPLMQELTDLRRRLDDFETRRGAITAEVEAAVERRLKAQKSITHYRDKLAEEQAKVDEAKALADKTEAEFQSWTQKASEYCERFENPRDKDEVEKQLQAVQNALKKREERHGATVEEMTIEVNKARSALDSVGEEIRQMAKLNKMLRRSLHARTMRWQEFRLHIALRTKIIFQFNLANRGFYGKVLFDHAKEELHLKVQTDDIAHTQATASREKDPRSLSGGEKSFSTICLLLALWDAINCPIRCLDEFDVFMDAVNRRITMKMMIETANASHQKQYILITPQDMNNVHIGKTVRVHRMTDPERGQGTLAFNN